MGASGFSVGGTDADKLVKPLRKDNIYMTDTQRFKLTIRDIRANESHTEIGQIQHFLRRFGYLKAGFEQGLLDNLTQNAIKTYQSYMGIPSTGVLDPTTADELEKPRCGVPDMPRGGASTGVSADFLLKGCSYFAKFRTLTYAFVNSTTDIIGTQELSAVRNAFDTWQAAIPIDFSQVNLANSPNFRVGWFTGNHGDGSPFDGVGNTLAHAFFPPPCGGSRAGDMHFDDAETWGLTDSGGVFDVETVALHEIGHLLGLDHSNVSGAVMFPSYGGKRRMLTSDDVAGIQTLYGKRGPSLRVQVHLENRGDVTSRENEFAGTRGQSRRLEGFQINFIPNVPGLGMRYMAHLQTSGDVPFVNAGTYIGTRGQSRRLEGFAIELTGPEARNYNVFYMAHLQGTGDTAVYQNGQFCGTRGQSRRVEGILIRVERR